MSSIGKGLITCEKSNFSDIVLVSLKTVIFIRLLLIVSGTMDVGEYFIGEAKKGASNREVG